MKIAIWDIIKCQHGRNASFDYHGKEKWKTILFDHSVVSVIALMAIWYGVVRYQVSELIDVVGLRKITERLVIIECRI